MCHTDLKWKNPYVIQSRGESEHSRKLLKYLRHILLEMWDSLGELKDVRRTCLSEMCYVQILVDLVNFNNMILIPQISTKSIVRNIQIVRERTDTEKWKGILLPEPHCWILQMSLSEGGASPYLTSEVFEEIWEMHPKERGTGKIFGKEVVFPRWQESYGKPYYFTGKLHECKPVDSHPYLVTILAYVNSLYKGIQKTGYPTLLGGEGKKDGRVEYNQILINWYNDGNDYIGPHSDDESQLVKGSSVYSFSFGEERDFYVRHKTNKEYKLDLKMKDNTLVVMGGDMQKHFKHSVPKRVGKKNPLGRRINITMRAFK